MKTIHINGKEYPCEVTGGALLRYEDMYGADAVTAVADGAATQSIKQTIAFAYCCVKGACNREGIPFDMDLITFADCIDLGEMATIMTAQADTASNPDGDVKKN